MVNLFTLIFISLSFQYVTSQQCLDENQHCKFWSQNGECEKNPRWMTKHCQRSCGTCKMIAPTHKTTRLSTAITTTMEPILITSPPRRSDNPVPEGCRSVMTVEVEVRQIFSMQSVRQKNIRQNCADRQIPPDCTINECFHKKYRSMDGSCNNLGKPAFGAALTPYTRLLSPNYDDGFNALVSSQRFNRPNPREVSVLLLSSPKSLPGHANSLIMQFGQFLSHDITANSAAVRCSCNTGGPSCASIPAPRNDRARKCVAFTRSFAMCGTGRNGITREQVNENTAFIDASLIYGSEAVTGRALRFNAMLRSHMMNGKIFPPMTGSSLSTGDNRATLFVGLSALHTTFLRLHNNLAAKLQNMNQHWNGDRIFQESRKIVGAIMQIITYKEFLPVLIGDSSKTLIGAYNGYNPNINPGILNEFSAGAYRLHGMIQEEYPLINGNFQKVGNIKFVEGMSSISGILTDLDSIYRGLMSIPVRSPQRITFSVTEKMFGGSMDMAVMNIQRGRDHGFRSYNDYRKLCNLPVVNDFNSWQEVQDDSVRQRVSELYKSPDDLDLYVGGILESPQPGSLVGPTFSCIIAKQFKNLRDGDRFYYENKNVFTSRQLASLQRVTLSWVLCQTGDRMTKISRNAFEIDNGLRAVPCSSIQSLDLSPWKE